jgi:hypothetical protein
MRRFLKLTPVNVDEGTLYLLASEILAVMEHPEYTCVHLGGSCHVYVREKADRILSAMPEVGISGGYVDVAKDTLGADHYREAA